MANDELISATRAFPRDQILTVGTRSGSFLVLDLEKMGQGQNHCILRTLNLKNEIDE